MSALAVAGRGWEDAGRHGDAGRPAQPRLFALPGGALEEPAAPATLASAAPAVVAPAAPAVVAPVAPAAVATAPSRSASLDDVLTGMWSELSAGHAAACPLCAGPVQPRWSAGAGAVGGRCGDCGTTID